MWLQNLGYILGVEPLHHGVVSSRCHVDSRARNHKLLNGMGIHVGHSVGDKSAIASSYNAKLHHI